MVMIMMIDQDEYEQSTNSQQQQQIRKRNHTKHTAIQQSHCDLALPFTLEKYLKAKEEELWKLKYFTACKKYNLQKNSSTRNQNPSTYYY
jgi:hypothetical protein